MTHNIDERMTGALFLAGSMFIIAAESLYAQTTPTVNYPPTDGCSFSSTYLEAPYPVLSFTGPCTGDSSAPGVLDIDFQGADGRRGGDANSTDRASMGYVGNTPPLLYSTMDAAIVQTQETQPAVRIFSSGGRGGDGGNGSGDHDGAAGNTGGSGGAITLYLYDLVRTELDQSIAVNLESTGGQGGNGGDGLGWTSGGRGGLGGNGGKITIENSSLIETSGDGSHGVKAFSDGGDGGAGGSGGYFFGQGGRGGDAGNSGNKISWENYSPAYSNLPNMTTQGRNAHGVWLLSRGGKGGATVSQDRLFVSIGGTGGAGGDSEQVSFASSGGGITTTGAHSYGLLAQSIGGGGGFGGSALSFGLFGSTAIGGRGGGGGDAGGVDASLGTSQSGDFASFIHTSGMHAHGMVAQSIGGGGGAGGDGQTYTIGTLPSISAAVGVSVGGAGGRGGHAGDVSFKISNGAIITGLDTSVTTYDPSDQLIAGDHSRGILAQSIGGGGGHGGSAIASGLSVSLEGSASVGVSVGGSGGDGGDGGNVAGQTQADGAISTYGRHATAIVMQSIGGGGGTAGHAFSLAAGASKNTGSVSTAIGGAGGDGGKSGDVTLSHGGHVFTGGSHSNGILAQSIGGGGGQGGTVLNVSAAVGKNAVSLSTSVGGDGGNGAVAGNVSLSTNPGSSIATLGHHSSAVLAQSIGGSGGAGGDVNNYAFSAITGSGRAASSDVGVGGAGGTGSKSGNVDLDFAGGVETYGAFSSGIHGQSIGGSGGRGGSVASLAVSVSVDQTSGREANQGGQDLALNVDVGGKGGAGKDAQNVSLTLAEGASINTSGDHSPGIELDSVGGGGGHGGHAEANTVASSFPSKERGSQFRPFLARKSVSFWKWLNNENNPESPKNSRRGLGITTSIGGSGGAAGTGGEISLTLNGESSVTTSGLLSPGLSARSIGGGGGYGGFADAHGYSVMDVLTLQVSVGGSGNGGGMGGDISVKHDSSSSGQSLISTSGYASPGMFLQSIGGGGGTAGHSSALDTLVPATSGSSMSFSLGSSGGGGGDGGNIDVTTNARVQTSGDDSAGILLQSIGGGGGNTIATHAGGATVDIHVNAGKSPGGDSGGVTLNFAGDIATTGMGSQGVFAQTIGGGGGLIQPGKQPAGPDSIIEEAYDDIKLPVNEAVDFKDRMLNDVVTTIYEAGQSGPSDAIGSLVFLGGTISTTGDIAPGLHIQSIGGGGAHARFDGNKDNPATIAVQSEANLDQSYASGSAGQITVLPLDPNNGDIAQRSRITTRGNGSHGILAHAISGGGMSVSGTDFFVDEYERIKTDFSSQPSSHSSPPSESRIRVDLAGDIQTSGGNAHGILALNHFASILTLGTHGISIDRNLSYIPQGSNTTSVSLDHDSRISTSGRASHGIYTHTIGDPTNSFVDIIVDGSVSVEGEDSWGLYAESVGTANSWDAYGESSMRIGEGASITASDNSAGAIYSNGQVFQNINVRGTISAEDSASGIAISSNTLTNINVDTQGVILGDIEMRSNTSAFEMNVNNSGFISGSMSGNIVYGIADGEHRLTVDPAGAQSDKLDVKVLSLEGLVTPKLSSLLDFSAPSEIIKLVDFEDSSELQTTSDPTQPGINTRTLATEFVIETTNNSATITDAKTDFTDLNGSASTGATGTLANQLLSDLRENDPNATPEVAGLLLVAANATNVTSFNSVLDHLDPAEHLPQASQSAQATGSQMDKMHSCGQVSGEYAAIAQVDCVWGKISASQTNFENGGKSTSWHLGLGRQDFVTDNILLGASFGYQNLQYSNSASRSDGWMAHLGAIAKYVNGPAYLSFGVAFSREQGTTDRTIMLPFQRLNAHANQSRNLYSARMRAAYLLPFNLVDVTPTIDLDLNWVDDNGYKENGAGALNIIVEGETHFFADVSPRVKFSKDYSISKKNIFRGFFELGADIALNNSSFDYSLPDSQSSGFVHKSDFKRDKTALTVSAGVRLLGGDKHELGLEYIGRFSDSSKSHVGELRYNLRF